MALYCCFVRKNGQPSEDFATRANSGAALERITPAGARIYEILHRPEAFTVQTIAAAEHIKDRHYLLAPDQRLPNDFVLIAALAGA